MTPQPTTRFPRVLVLLATYNGGRFLSEQLDSLARQTDVNLRILASDDGSTDNTLDILRNAAASGLDVQILPPSTPSGAAAQNFFRLFQSARFDDVDFVALCDQDDVWLEYKLRRGCEMLSATQSDAYSCNSIAFWPNGKESYIKKDFPQQRFDMLFESASHGCTYIVTADTARAFASEIDRLGKQVKRVDFHDWLLYAWSRSTGRKWFFDSKACIRYRQSGHNVIGANVGLRALKSRLAMLGDGWLSKQSIIIADCIGWADHPLVSRLLRNQWRDRLWIARLAWQCRRRPRDQWMFFIACLTTGI